jgi:hypothetical protein
MDPQVMYVKQRLQNYFQRIIELSAAAEPPGKNAANGWLREYMVNDGVIIQCGAAPTVPVSDDALKLFQAYSYFYVLLERAFRDNGNHYSSIALAPHVLFDNMGAFLGDLITVIASIVSLIEGDQNQQDAAEASVVQAVTKLAKDVANSGVVWSGAHANGWISVYAQAAANWTIQNQLNVNFPKGTATDAGAVADVLRSVCERIAALDTKGHDPWLRADWQVSFETIMRAAVVTLASLGQPKARTAGAR